MCWDKLSFYTDKGKEEYGIQTQGEVPYEDSASRNLEAEKASDVLVPVIQELFLLSVLICLPLEVR